ncbi:hypothetical protein BDK51DRAFT_36489 [Blyttiomyces helicus]|uniref:HCP-like protein n=1 Tax=Blyttiomyces helicus TaxID=388810 RepID=A0A4P9W032_9FUNG|nr:hypothetical protein BDK51DRAFT_36489 [Blyttiomyces helicus]|eukprot:RKO84982.1 hypothetical protein BDK51DRAFT_36489 [Blyttiomyces helicus]
MSGKERSEVGVWIGRAEAGQGIVPLGGAVVVDVRRAFHPPFSSSSSTPSSPSSPSSLLEADVLYSHSPPLTPALQMSPLIAGYLFEPTTGTAAAPSCSARGFFEKTVCAQRHVHTSCRPSRVPSPFQSPPVPPNPAEPSGRSKSSSWSPRSEPGDYPASVKAFVAVCGAYSGRVLYDEERRERLVGRISGFWEDLKQPVMARSSSAPSALPSSQADAEMEVVLPWVVQTQPPPPPPAPVIPLRAGLLPPLAFAPTPTLVLPLPLIKLTRIADPPSPVLASAKHVVRVEDEGVVADETVRGAETQTETAAAAEESVRADIKKVAVEATVPVPAKPYPAHRRPSTASRLSDLVTAHDLRETNILGLVALGASPSTPRGSTRSTKRSLSSPPASHAASLFEAAAERGYPKAAFNAALCHHRGIGGANRDPDRAIVLYRQAAHAGHPPAEYNLGVMLLDLAKEQKSVEKWNEAVGWIESAARHGFEPALKAVAELKLGAVDEAVDVQGAADCAA